MITTHVHHVAEIRGLEAVKLASGTYTRTILITNEDGEKFELCVYAPTATQLFILPERGE
jgi:hypothetical protein